MTNNRPKIRIDRLDDPDFTVQKKKSNRLPIIALALSFTPVLFYFLMPIDRISLHLFILIVSTFSLVGLATGGTVILWKRNHTTGAGIVLSLIAIFLSPFLLSIILSSL